MKKMIVVLFLNVVFLLLSFLYLDYSDNKLDFENINSFDNKIYNVVVSNKKEYDKLMDIVNKEKLNLYALRVINNEKVIYANFNYDSSKYNNNKYDKYIFKNKTGIIKNTIINEAKLYEMKDNKLYFGKFSYLKENTSEDELITLLKKDNLNIVVANIIDVKSPLYILINIIIYVLTFLVNFFVIQYLLYKQKMYGIIKFYAIKNSLLFKKIFIYDLYNLLFVLLGILLIIFLNISKVYIIYLIAYFIIMLIIHILFCKRDNKKNIISQIKGKLDTFKVQMFYRFIVIISFVFIILIALFCYGNNADIKPQLVMSNYSLYKDYAVLNQNEQGSISSKDVIDKLYQKLIDEKAIFFENNVFSNYSFYQYNKNNSLELNNEYIKEYQNKPIITINNNYALLNNIVSSVELKANDIILYASNKFKNKKEELNKKYCSYYDNSILENVLVNKCKVIISNNDKLFVGSYVNDDINGMDDNVIYRIMKDSYLKKEYYDVNYNMFIPLNKMDLDKRFNNLKMIVNDESLLGDNGLYNRMSNIYNDNIMLIKLMDDSLIIANIIIIVLVIVSVFVIYTFLRLYIIANAKKLLILKINGTNIIKRYLSLFNYLIILLIISFFGTTFFATFNNLCNISINFIILSILIYLIVTIVSIYFIYRIENKNLLSVIKGEEL